MYSNLSNFTMNTITAPTMDKGIGVFLASADSKPRMLLSASVYSSGNTTNVTPILAMCPSQQLGANGTLDANTETVCYLARSSQAINDSLTSTYAPGTLVPYIETRAGGGSFPIIPPGWILVGINGDVDADGGLIWSVCTCDLG